jgi:hypothetical protein
VLRFYSNPIIELRYDESVVSINAAERSQKNSVNIFAALDASAALSHSCRPTGWPAGSARYAARPVYAWMSGTRLRTRTPADSRLTLSGYDVPGPYVLCLA